MNEVKGKKVIFSINTIIFICFAIRGINDGMLAFTSSEYTSFFGLIISIIVYLTLPLGLLYVINTRVVEKRSLFLCLIPFAFLFLLIFHTYQGYHGFWISAFIAGSCFLLMSSTDKAKVFRIMYILLQTQNLISIILYLFALVRINIGFSTVPYYTGVVGCSYYKWGIFAILQQGLSQLRLCGIFNEPGGLGTICAFMFIVCYSSISKKEKILLLVTIAFTFSLAGYLLVFLYIGLYLIKKDKKFIFLVVGLGIVFFILPDIDFGNESINYLVQRMRLTDTGLAGDSRYDMMFDSFYSNFLFSKKSLLGYGYGYPVVAGVSTYKAWIVQFGILGFLGYVLLIVILAIKESEKNKYCLLLIALFVISIYQRPLSISSLYGFIILFGGINYIKHKSNDYILLK